MKAQECRAGGKYQAKERGAFQSEDRPRAPYPGEALPNSNKEEPWRWYPFAEFFSRRQQQQA